MELLISLIHTSWTDKSNSWTFCLICPGATADWKSPIQPEAAAAGYTKPLWVHIFLKRHSRCTRWFLFECYRTHTAAEQPPHRMAWQSLPFIFIISGLCQHFNDNIIISILVKRAADYNYIWQHKMVRDSLPMPYTKWNIYCNSLLALMACDVYMCRVHNMSIESQGYANARMEGKNKK